MKTFPIKMMMCADYLVKVTEQRAERSNVPIYWRCSVTDFTSFRDFGRAKWCHHD